MATRRACVLIVATVAMAAVMTARAEPATESSSSELPPITVTPRPNPLEDERQRQRDRLEESTPCMGCGPTQEAGRRNVFRQIGEALSRLTGLPLEPPNVPPEERVEARVANDWRIAERAPEER